MPHAICTQRETRRARAIVASVALFVVLVAASMAVYPGGHSWDRTAVGHDFWRNFLCDLERESALDGSPNVLGAALGRAAMLILALGLLPFFARVSALAAGAARLGVVVRALATITVLAVPGVAFLSGDRFGKLHAVAVVVAGIPGLAACAGAVAALLVDREAPRIVAWAGALALGIGAVDFSLYVRSFTDPQGGTVAVAVLERLATLALLLWMVLAARHAPMRTEARTAVPPSAESAPDVSTEGLGGCSSLSPAGRLPR